MTTQPTTPEVDKEGLELYYQRENQRLREALEESEAKLATAQELYRTPAEMERLNARIEAEKLLTPQLLTERHDEISVCVAQGIVPPVLELQDERTKRALAQLEGLAAGYILEWDAPLEFLPDDWRPCEGQRLAFCWWPDLVGVWGNFPKPGDYFQVPTLPGKVIKVGRENKTAQELPNQGLKFDDAKSPLDLLPMGALIQVAEVLRKGAEKYGRNNWQKGMRWTRLLGGSLRHIFAWAMGENIDAETGCSHLACAVCGLLFLISYQTYNKGEDDRDQVSL